VCKPATDTAHVAIVQQALSKSERRAAGASCFLDSNKIGSNPWIRERRVFASRADMRAAGAVAPSRWGASAPHSRDGYRPPPRVHGAIRGIGIPRRNPGRVLISKTRVFGAEEVGTIVPYALDVVTVGSALFSAGTTTDVNELPAAVLQGLTQVIPHPSFVSETARVLGAAIFDQHSVWWAIASPLFALSVAPYLLFLKRMYDAPSATDEMRASFATLLLFVVVSIPAEAYTQEAYGTVLSNIDALHFLIQAAISLTNLRVMLAFRDAAGFASARSAEGTTLTEQRKTSPTESVQQSGDTEWDGEGWDGRLNSARGGAFVSVDWGAGGDGGNASSNGASTSNFQRSAEKLRPAQLVEAAAGVALVSTFGLMALDSRLVRLEDLGLGGSGELQLLVSNFRAAAQTFSADVCAPGLPTGPPNALSVPTWGVHVFSLVEWLVAMGLVWSYAGVSKNKSWRLLTWGMLPLHASGVCACAQHFFFNANDLEWLVAAQGGLTFVGNAGMCFAAGRIREVDNEMAAVAESSLVGSAGTLSASRTTLSASNTGVAAPTSRKGENAPDANSNRINLSAYFADFDVENFAELWRRDGDALFASKIALLSLIVAAIVRAASLASGPYTGDGGDLQWARGWVAFAFVTVPFLLNAQKWKRRGDAEDEFALKLSFVAAGVSGADVVNDVSVTGGITLNGKNGSNGGGATSAQKAVDAEVKANSR
jgi:hypothetical protein